MRNKKFFLITLIVALLLGAVPVLAGPAEDQAASVAQSWLGLVDSGKLEQAYSQMAASAKQQAPRDSFVGQIRAGRKKVGTVTGRSVLSKKMAHNPAGAPPGDYAIVEFNTNFSVKGASVERVTSVKEADGKWRVGGYYIVK